MVEHRFGGTWTERKLAALGAYLEAYQTIFKHNPRAQTLATVYVDAFAGTGERDVTDAAAGQSLFGYETDMRGYHEGSVTIALSIPEKFDRYIFLDNKANHVVALREVLIQQFPDLADRCLIEQAEANRWLQGWCRTEDWRTQRAVVFLDPYGMAVEWETVRAIAGTKAIDLWVLFPLGIGASRVMPNEMPPEGPWAERLTKLFGTNEWRERFYRRERKRDLFEEEEESWMKIGGIREILTLFLERLSSEFAQIVERPLILKNSKNSPMYALCFAAGNPQGAKTAVRIASHLTRE